MTAPDPRSGVVAFLAREGLLADGEQPTLTPLTGGVSSDLWMVDLPGGTVCVKGALAQLKVAYEWVAPLSRNRVEYDWLRFAAAISPGQVPRVLAHDPDAGLFAMEFLPPQQYPVWKTQLLGGHVDLAAARAVGDLVGRLHAASATDPDCPVRFATDDNFDALRIEPYLRVTARAHPDLHQQFDRVTATTTDTHRAVVHGDVSPKNILLGPVGPVLLDAECAWFGDPAFDIAFCLNHLLLKQVKLPGHAAELHEAAHALLAGYRGHIDWEPPETVAGRIATLLPALALARVDGASPVEYLDAAERDIVRSISRALLQKPPATLADVLNRWSESADAATSGTRQKEPTP